MKAVRFHMPHFHMPHRAASHAAPGEHHHHHQAGFLRLRQAENLIDLLIVGGIVLLAAAMAYGLLTASGDARWW